MKTVAIISEYNPFHNGHKYQIDKIRELLGEDTAIVAIMSGNFTQRGELAIADKTVRAKTAVLCGVDLVLELPFPYSSSSAEFFARSGVKIATEIGADYLAFGSESGNIDTIKKIADVMASDKFKSALDKLTDDKSYASLGHAQMIELAYGQVTDETPDFDITGANNILALEYVKAIKFFGSNIIPITIKREGADYNNDEIDGDLTFQSATSIRADLYKDGSSAPKYMPNIAFDELNLAKENGLAPSSIEALSPAIISTLRLNSAYDIDIHDADDGLYNRLCTLSMKTKSISSLTALAETKKYTKARIRRAILYSFFGVTSSIVKEYPRFTQVLAMNDTGRKVLKGIKNSTGFACITKPSDYLHLSPDVIAQKELANKADAIYALSLPGDIPGAFPLTFTPFVKK